MSVTTTAFQHPAFFYDGADDYVGGAVPFLLAGLEAGQPVAAALPAAGLALLRKALGGAAARIKMIDMGEVGRNPGRIINAVLCAFLEAHPGRRVRLLCEAVWPGRTPVEYPACAQHEALVNLALDGREATMMCLYDRSRLDDQAIKDAEATHPMLVSRGETCSPSAAYAPAEVLARYNAPLTPPPADVAILSFGSDELDRVREFTMKAATGAGLLRMRAGDAELAVNELAANSIRYGGGRGTARVWRENGHVVCEVSDGGTITDPLVGRCPVGDSTRGGRGILMVNLMADLVRTYSSADGTTTRLLFRREV